MALFKTRPNYSNMIFRSAPMYSRRCKSHLIWLMLVILTCCEMRPPCTLVQTQTESIQGAAQYNVDRSQQHNYLYESLASVKHAAGQGAIAAVIAAALSAFTEPALNRVLVERCTMVSAMSEVALSDCLKFFCVACPMNLLKFPFFEIVDMILSFTALNGTVRGAVNGLLFCTFMLPCTNIRFRRSMNLPIGVGCLYEAYPPTVLRDITYGLSRGLVGGLIVAHMHGGSDDGLLKEKTMLFGITVFLAGVISSPFNEWRGYWLQPPHRKLPFREFFKLESYIRSSCVTAAVMGISYAASQHITAASSNLGSLSFRR